MTTIQTAMTLSTGDDAVTRRVGFDLAQANTYRAAWMLDAQQLAEQAPLRGTGSVAVATVIDQVRKSLAPEFRLAGVALHVTFADGVGSDSVDEQVLGLGLTGALVALLPIVDLTDRPSSRFARPASSRRRRSRSRAPACRCRRTGRDACSMSRGRIGRAAGRRCSAPSPPGPPPNVSAAK